VGKGKSPILPNGLNGRLFCEIPCMLISGSIPGRMVKHSKRKTENCPVIFVEISFVI
jgi:hypothetical protein